MSHYETEPGVGGWPLGYFMIKDASGRVLDVEGERTDDGSELILFTCKEPSRVLPLRDPIANNQVFFIDLEGNLCSLHSGHAVDIQGASLLCATQCTALYSH
jgi:hypothetical protein